MAHRIGGDPVSFHTPAPEEGPRPTAPARTLLKPPGDRIELTQPRLPSSLLISSALDGKGSFVKIGSDGRLELTKSAKERSQIKDVFNSVKGALDDIPLLPSDYDALQRNMDSLHAKQGKGFWNQLRTMLSPAYREYRGQVDAARSELTSAIAKRKEAAEIMQRALSRKEGKDLLEKSRAGDSERRTTRAEQRATPKPAQTETASVAPLSTRDAPTLIAKAERASARSDAAVRTLSQNVSVPSLGEAMESLRDLTMQLRRLRQAKLQASRKGMDPSVTQKIDVQISNLEAKHQSLAAALAKAGKK